MNPKFTLITHDYPPAHGGIARYLSSLATAAQGRIDVWVPANSSNVKRQTSNEIGQPRDFDVRRSTFDVNKVKFRWPLWPHWLPLVKRCLEVPQENIILVSHVFPIGTAAWMAKALGGSDYTIIFHGTDLKRAQTKWKRWLLRRICNNASLLIVNSQATRKLLKRLVPAANPLVLTPGLEPFNLPDKPDARARLGVANDAKVILAVSRLVERKGLDTLIQAVANLESRISNLASETSGAKYKVRDSKFELVIVGNGPYAEPLHKLAELSGVDVRWVANADDETLHSWYAAADIFCLPGRETIDDVEGFGMVFLEAAYAGLPVIAGESGGASEAVIGNETGLLIPPTVDACANALGKLLDNQNLAKQLGANGRNRVIKDFNWSDRWSILQNIEFRTLNMESKNTSSKFQVPSSVLDISVVIPCHNHAKELKDTLESLAGQTVIIKEVIIVDDASTDDVAQIAKIFEGILPIKLLRHEHNRGASAARNTGLKSAIGEFVIFLDADIILKPQALEMMHAALAANLDAAYAYSDFYWGMIHFKGQPFSVASLHKLNYIHTSSLIRRKDAIEFDETLKKFQDWDVWLSLANQGKVGIWVPEVLFKVMERKTGMSRWLPSFAHKIPWPILGYTPREIKRYREAEGVIREKHEL